MSDGLRSATRFVGVATLRPDVPPKLDGSFVFSNDLSVPGMLFGATVRSAMPHARIEGLDVGHALTLDGTICVLTIDDVPGNRRIGHIVTDQPVFADGVVRYHGEPVAFVVAHSQEQAWRAADAVVVHYDPLPVVDDPQHALAAESPRVHPGGNLVRRLHLRRGCSELHAAVEVAGEWETGRQDQAFLGPESALARPDPDGGVTVHVATQDLHADRAQIAAALGFDEHLVRVVNSGIGGAFGGREDITSQIHLALAALRTGRPVKTTYRRGESFLAHPKRHPARMRFRVGADADGTLRYVHARLLLDGGAYASTSGPVLGTACYSAAGPYRVPSVDILGESVYTNNPIAGAMRGFGAVQACFGIESTMDLLAARLDMDPVLLRRINALRPGDAFPTSGQICGPSTPVIELIDRCAALAMPAAPPVRQLPGGSGGTTRGEGVRRGIGFALGVKSTLYAAGVPEHSSARVRIVGAGTEIVSAAAECGQGIESALVQIAKEELGGLPVRVGPASTEAAHAGSSSASRQTWMSGAAVQLAAIDARGELIATVAARFAVTRDEVDLADGCVIVAGRSLALDEALDDAMIDVERTYEAPPTDPGDPIDGQGDVHVSRMYVAHRAVVDVDVDLGLVRVVQIATAQDVGRAVNPREVRSQIAGGISQGIGLALSEHLYAVGGMVRNASFTDYLIPTTLDMPALEVELVEVPEPLAPYGLKGAGEPPSLSSTAAVAAAVRDATGRSVPRVPIRPDDLVL